ncbi:MAG TPA: flagellar hook capping FlgD N-terminal domain-containing protein [Phycisphaerales bacterium]|nr:flagellar hook capping FlgD N-terminal domain-containing protein [Phycisphaerales bacterium]
MDVSSVLGSTGASGGGFSALSSEDFTKIVLTELSKQDPLQPNDTNALLQQLSTIRSIQSDMDLTDGLKSLVQQSDFAAAAGMIGRTVSGVSLSNERVTGEVESVGRTRDGVFVKLKDGAVLQLKNLDRVDAAAA